MPELKKAIVNFKEAVLNSSDDPEIIKGVLDAESRSYFLARVDSKSRNDGDFYSSDLYLMAKRMHENNGLKDPKLKKASASLMKAVKDANPESHHDNYNIYKYFKGLGIMNADKPELYKAYNYQDLAFARDTGWDEFNLNYAPQVDTKALIGKLSSQKIKIPQLKEISKLAKIASKKAKSGNDKKELKPYLDKIIDSLESIPEDQEKAKSALRSIAVRASERGSYNRYYSPFFQESMALLSAFDGEISQKTLAKAASNLLEAAHENRDNPTVQFRVEKSGLMTVKDLAYMTDNYNILHLLSYSGDSVRQYLQKIADLKA